jgi:citrate-Mg2+:H+ or citrate-Ca2+:H+ symporter, CitMHS family
LNREFLMLILLGYLMVVTFMVLIMTRRLSALVALILVPLAFGLLAGHRTDLGPMAIDGISKLAPTAALLLFAVLYFSIMIDTGLFDPLVRGVLRIVGNDPRRIAIGTAAVALVVSLDGDGATTALVTITAFLPVYRRLGMNPLILAVLLGSMNSIVNLAPWGGPTGRVAAALHLDPADVFVPLLPAMAAGVVATFVMAWFLGNRERKRLGVSGATTPVESVTLAFERDQGVARPRLIVFNLALTIAVLVSAVLRLLPMPLLFMAGLSLALVVNYPAVSAQRARLMAHAANALPIVLLILAAGIFTGIITGTGMVDAMAKGAMTAVPDRFGPWLGPITALLSAPLTFALSNDAYYFGAVPVIAQTGALYGIAPVEIARASLLGQPIHVLSPLVAALYLVAGLLDCEVGAMQRFSLKWAGLLAIVLIIAAIVTRAII